VLGYIFGHFFPQHPVTLPFEAEEKSIHSGHVKMREGEKSWTSSHAQLAHKKAET
jgi:hypothetical protein